MSLIARIAGGNEGLFRMKFRSDNDLEITNYKADPPFLKDYLIFKIPRLEFKAYSQH